MLPDVHWVGGNPWDGSRAGVYGWASWNGPKATLALRNGGTSAQMYLTTLREMLNIPANVSGSISFKKAFADQKALSGLSEDMPIDIDRVLTLRLPASSVFVFDGTDEDYEGPTGIENIGQRTDNNGQWSINLRPAGPAPADSAAEGTVYPQRQSERELTDDSLHHHWCDDKKSKNQSVWLTD